MSADADAGASTLASALTAVALLLAAGCHPKSASALYGVWVCDHRWARETLSLNRDGTFAHEVRLKSTSSVDVSRGMWDYNPRGGFLNLDGQVFCVVDPFGNFQPDYARRKDAAGTTITVDRIFWWMPLPHPCFEDWSFEK